MDFIPRARRTHPRSPWLAVVAATLVLLCLLAACNGPDLGGGSEQSEAHSEGRLLARPSNGGLQGPPLPAGLDRFDFGGRQHGWTYVPPDRGRRERGPVVLALHGAGGQGLPAVKRLIPLAERGGAIVVGVRSSGPTWDLVLGGFGTDVAFIDRALARVFDRAAVDPNLVGVQGFSDGASYALSLGVTNGDLFRRVVAFSPGFYEVEDPHGSPRVTVTHGRSDPVLPIDQTSRRIVPELQAMGLEVELEEFAGRHEIPDELYPEALSWLGG